MILRKLIWPTSILALLVRLRPDRVIRAVPRPRRSIE
jgi:hypothetical protein